MPCYYLRPSSGRELSDNLFSPENDDYLINEARRKPTNGARCSNLLHVARKLSNAYMPIVVIIS